MMASLADRKVRSTVVICELRFILSRWPCGLRRWSASALLLGIASSNPAGDGDICLLCLSCR